MNAVSKIKSKVTSADKQVSKDVGWLGTPVLIPGEDAIAFDEFAARIRAALKPSNTMPSVMANCGA